MSIETNDKKLFKKCRETSNKITELIAKNNATDFTKNNIDDDESIMVDVNINKSFIEGYFRGDLVIILHSVIDDCLEKFLVKAKIH